MIILDYPDIFESEANSERVKANSAKEGARCAEAKTFHNCQFTRDPKIVVHFNPSVNKMREGIARNKFNDYKGDPASNPEVCLHEIPEMWKLDLCSAPGCGADLGPTRLAEENKKAKDTVDEDAAQALLSPHVDRLHSLGISIVALLAFAFAHDCFGWPVWQVVRDIIVPATRDLRCRYADLPEFRDLGLFGKATVFMSHCWGATFGDLIGAACHGARMDRIVWIDIFAVRQWPGNVADLNFRGVIQKCNAMIVSISPVEGMLRGFDGQTEEDMCTAGAAFLASEEGITAKKIIPFLRLWCVVEIASAVDNKKPIIVKGGQLFKKKEFMNVKGGLPIEIKVTKNNEMYEYDIKCMRRNKDRRRPSHGLRLMMLNLRRMIDTENSECAVQADYDREMIIVRQMDGGVDYVNSLVKSVISGALISMGRSWQSVVEVDAALCGENELLFNMGIFPLQRRNLKLARTVLYAAYYGGRVEIVRLLLKRWDGKEKEEEEIVDRAEKEQEEKGGEMKSNQIGQSDGKEKNEEEEEKKKQDPLLCRLIKYSILLIEASRDENIEIVKMLLEVGGVENFVNDSGGGNAPPLYYACEKGFLEVVKALVNANGIDVNKGYVNDSGTPLYSACENGHVEVVKVLLNAKGIDMNKGKKNDGWSPLDIAKEKNHEEIVQLLQAAQTLKDGSMTK